MRADGKPFSLYIHIPYCVSKCPYCDFNSHVVAKIPEQAYAEALICEIDRYAASDDWHGRGIQSIFFGGGTPSTFHPASIGEILQRVARRWRLLDGCEVTLEANPGTVDRVNFHGYRACGVNRISLGVQSFQPQLLKFLGRIHSAEEARQALDVVRHAGFENFSLDLIYANPTQKLTDLESDIATALSFGSPHLSAYNLTIEEGTPFFHEFQSGRFQSLAEDEEIAMAELLERRLSDAGFARYEISNYAKPGFGSRHNINYWRGGDYLGVGAGSHSYKQMQSVGLMGRRWSNEKNPGRYMSQITQEGHAVVDREEIDSKKAAGEFMFLGLRMIEGISETEFHTRFDCGPGEFFPQLACWIDEGLMEKSNDYLRFTRRGLLVANSIFVQFM